MRSVRMSAVAAFVAVLWLTACANQPDKMPFETTPLPATPEFGQGDGAYPEPGAAATATGAYPEPGAAPPASATDDGRSQTALKSYQTALTWVTQNYSPSAEFYGVVPSRTMIANLGNPPIAQGWFYKFRAADRSGDMFVQVVNGEYSGSRELIPLAEPQPAEEAVAFDRVKIDSDQVLELFRTNAPTKGITLQEGISYDIELVQIAGQSDPIWSVVAPEGGEWLYSINAITGEEAPNPRG